MSSNNEERPIPMESIMRRLCIFSFYDADGVVDDYVIHFLKEMGRHVERILFYSNGPLTRQAEVALHDLVHKVILRPNVGFDVLAYKEGLEYIDFNKERLYDEVLMVNHTCYGPIFPFEELFSAMSQRRCDFWGVTAHMEMTPNPFTGTGTLPYHLNSNFIVVRKDMLCSQSFRNYWGKISGSLTYETAVQSHETVFTQHFTKLGYVCECYLDCARYGSHYPAFIDIDETMVDRSPLLKRRAFFHDPRFLEHYCVDLPRALDIIEQTSDYDRSMIWQNITRSAELRTLNTNAALTSVLPDVRLKQDASQPSLRVALCVHMFYTDMLEEILALGDTVPGKYDFVATTASEDSKLIIEAAARQRSNVANVIVRVVEQNRGRDMSSLLITCRDLFLEDHYDLVCRLHTKKTPHLASSRAGGFKRHMFENLLNSKGYTANVLDMFQDKPWIGVAVPPIIHISYGTLGHAWYANKGRAEELARQLKLNVRLDPDTPVGAFGGMYWFRPKALRKLFLHSWKWTDFDPEPYPLDGSLGHALERLITYVAQDARYTTQQIISSHLAGVNYTMLEYKLQRLSAAMPSGDFNYQTHILDEWKRTGYRATDMSDSARQPLSFHQAVGELSLAIKRSLAHRAPRLTRVLQLLKRTAPSKSSGAQ
ncbi:rhamnosyltransferase [Dyella sp. OK004]|uniref:rhamnan synthesis F family protein n=1 Tax=Dyella sp. OK004 TaxID=1855292 RepID=UPI0008E5830D|nr:rhamnan synthesis F family protein [Dyella sp. OK004]SFS07880.1 rhamnosyltransferase [Dyella sp. OK004]